LKANVNVILGLSTIGWNNNLFSAGLYIVWICYSTWTWSSLSGSKVYVVGH